MEQNTNRIENDTRSETEKREITLTPEERQAVIAEIIATLKQIGIIGDD